MASLFAWTELILNVNTISDAASSENETADAVVLVIDQDACVHIFVDTCIVSKCISNVSD